MQNSIAIIVLFFISWEWETKSWVYSCDLRTTYILSGEVRRPEISGVCLHCWLLWNMHLLSRFKAQLHVYTLHCIPGFEMSQPLIFVFWKKNLVWCFRESSMKLLCSRNKDQIKWRGARAGFWFSDSQCGVHVNIRRWVIKTSMLQIAIHIFYLVLFSGLINWNDVIF